jgi:hypothetical protein
VNVPAAPVCLHRPSPKLAGEVIFDARVPLLDRVEFVVI